LGEDKNISEILEKSNLFKNLKKARNETYVQQEFVNLFKDELGLELRLNERLIKGFPDSLFEDIILDYKFSKNFSESQEKDWVKNKAKQYMDEFEHEFGRKARMLIILSEKWIKYYDKDLNFIRETELNLNSIKSLILSIKEYKQINSKLFSDLFGVNSPIFSEIFQYMKRYYEAHHDKIEILFKEWRQRFQIAYGLEEEDIDVFFRHSYLSLLIKVILFIAYLPKKVFSKDTFLELVDYFEKRNIAIFQYDFFYWTLNIEYITELLYNKLKSVKFEVEDIFKTIYQEFIKYDLKHEQGEYYTPNELAQLMIKKVYEFNTTVLDPACGSGTFLIETIKKILQSNHSEEEKINACKKIYGFDLNPIAVLTTKANILLLFKINKIDNFNLNVYLCDSLFPIEQEEFQTIDYGPTEKYHLSAIDKYINISSKFFEERTKFIKILKILDTSFNDTDDSQELIQIVFDICNTNGLKDFLDQPIGNMGFTLADNLKKIIIQLHQLHVNQKDKIWLYLLYNYVGVKELFNFVDIIIGNPPWVVLNSLSSKSYQEKIKNLAAYLNIKPSAKQITNLEEATLFFYRCPQLYGKKDSKIFFVMTREVILGDHAQHFRYFSNFEDIKIWDFTPETQKKVFKVPHICVIASYRKKNIKGRKKLKDKLPIPCKIYDYDFGRNSYVLDKMIELIPYKINDKKNLAKRFIIPEEKEKLIDLKKSPYYDDIHKGADLYPRSLIFVKTEDIGHNLSLISTDKRILKRAKDPWNKEYIKDEKVNNEYLFQCVLSKNVYPFIVKDFFTVFLPYSIDIIFEGIDTLPTYSKLLYEKINEIYIDKKKESTSKEALVENLDHWGKLTKPDQTAKYKVVYTASGSSPESAVIKDKTVIIDYTLMYLGTNNLNEAYYLCAIFNSEFLAENLSRIKSSRHIMKRLVEFPIPQFNPDDTNHQRLSYLAKNCESELIKKRNDHKFSKTKILELISDQMKEINELTKLILIK